MGHTPGIWTYRMGRWADGAEPFGFSIVVEGKDPAICRAGTSEPHVLILGKIWREAPSYAEIAAKHFTPEEVEANARLIAAAPDLLAALKAILEGRPELWGDDVHDGITDFPIEEAALFAADEAIKKAEGQ